jgi:hypothetical protein
MIKRSEYMNGRVNHQTYYGQFVTPQVTNLVKTYIGEDKIKNSTDPHFNDISLSKWDRLSQGIIHLVGPRIAEANRPSPDAKTGISLSDTVCVAKEAARRIREALDSPSP